MLTESHPSTDQRHAAIPRPRVGRKLVGRVAGNPNKPLTSPCSHLVERLGPVRPGQILLPVECGGTAYGTLGMVDPVTGRRVVWHWCTWSHRAGLLRALASAGWALPAAA